MNFKIKFPGGYRVSDIENDNLDVNVILPGGEVYFGCLFTLANIRQLMEQEGDHAFWATDMIVVSNLTRQTISKAIQELIDDGYLTQAFTHIGHISRVYSAYTTYEDVPCCILRVVL